MGDFKIKDEAYRLVAAKNETDEAPAFSLHLALAAVHRMRKQLRQLFRQTIDETVDAAGEIDAEMRHLVTVLSRA